MKSADTSILSPRRRLQMGSNPPISTLSAGVKAGHRAESPRQSISLILLDRPTHKKGPRSTGSVPRRPTRPRSGRIEKKKNEGQLKACSRSAEKEKKPRAEVSLDQAVLELSEIKAEYHLENTETQRNFQALKSAQKPKIEAAMPREQRLADRLAAAEKAMRVLYDRNQELESALAAQPLPHQDCQRDISILEAETAALSGEIQRLQGQLTAQYEARLKGAQEFTPSFIETRIRDSLKDSKRYLGYYWALRDMVQPLGPHSSLSVLIDFERKAREEDRREFEVRLGKWEKLNCDLYVRRQLLLHSTSI